MREILRAAERALDAAIVAFVALALAIVAGLVACVTLEVVMRYFVGAPTKWVNEFSEYSLLWLAFLAGAWVLREEGHVKVEMLVEVLPRAQQRFLRVVTSLTGAGVCALFCWVSASHVIELMESGEIMFKSVQLPKWTVMAVIPPGLSLLALQFLRRAFRPPPATAATGF